MNEQEGRFLDPPVFSLCFRQGLLVCLVVTAIQLAGDREDRGAAGVLDHDVRGVVLPRFAGVGDVHSAVAPETRLWRPVPLPA